MSICMMHLSRLSEEIILWCSWEFKFIELDDAFHHGLVHHAAEEKPRRHRADPRQNGPRLRRPEHAARDDEGHPARLRQGHAGGQGGPVRRGGHAAPVPVTVAPMLATMRTLPENMRRAAARGFINATDCADYLTKKGMPFRDAYKLTGSMVSACIAAGKTLEELTLGRVSGRTAPCLKATSTTPSTS
jgi:argininosuccinate lyase